MNAQKGKRCEAFLRKSRQTHACGPVGEERSGWRKGWGERHVGWGDQAHSGIQPLS